MRELVAEFVANMSERARAFEAAHAAGNDADLTRAAHQLKGAAAGYGFEQIGEAAGVLEAAVCATGNNNHAVQSAVNELVNLCQRAEVGPAENDGDAAAA